MGKLVVCKSNLVGDEVHSEFEQEGDQFNVSGTVLIVGVRGHNEDGGDEREEIIKGSKV